MAYRIIKTIKGRQYIYEQETWREKGQVRTKSTYIGPLDPIHRTTRAPSLHTTQLSAVDIEACLRSADFERFLSNPQRGRYPIAIAPTSFAEVLPHKRREIFISAETQSKIIAKHPEVTVSEFQRFAYRLENAEVYLDRKERHVILFMDDYYWWRAVLKGTALGELYVQTYHRTNARQIAKTKGRDKRVL